MRDQVNVSSNRQQPEMSNTEVGARHNFFEYHSAAAIKDFCFKTMYCLSTSEFFNSLPKKEKQQFMDMLYILRTDAILDLKLQKKLNRILKAE